jgi:integrase
MLTGLVLSALQGREHDEGAGDLLLGLGQGVLHDLRQLVAANQARGLDPGREDAHVFPTTTGTTTSGTNLLGRHFKPHLKRAGLPGIRLHDLRHTCATILLMAGKHPKFAQEMFGHANISITLDTYSHMIESMDGGARGRYGRRTLMSIAAAWLPSGIMASPGCGEIRIDKPMRP